MKCPGDASRLAHSEASGYYVSPLEIFASFKPVARRHNLLRRSVLLLSMAVSMLEMMSYGGRLLSDPFGY
jgi:hypothetical protein